MSRTAYKPQCHIRIWGVLLQSDRTSQKIFFTFLICLKLTFSLSSTTMDFKNWSGFNIFRRAVGIDRTNKIQFLLKQDMRSTQLVILFKNLYTSWGRNGFLISVTYFPTNLVFPFTLRVTSKNRISNKYIKGSFGI